MDWHEHIHSDPDILGGKPVIRGTRISVELVLEYLTDGADVEAILKAYPHLTKGQIASAISFARDMVAEEADAARRRAA